MTPELHRETPYASSDERPPWVEEFADPTHWDLAFGSYGDGYLEWVNARYFWDPTDLRTTADTRTLWDRRHRYDDDSDIVELNARQSRRRSRKPIA